jgi:ubiquinone/menaquinone biosynthesis C-methylase UbiE
MSVRTKKTKGYIGVPMEGGVARRYAANRRSGNQLDVYRRQAAELIEHLPDGAAVLEVAPGPGYLAIEIARAGRLSVTGLDISRTFVEIAGENAREAGVSVDFRLGDASAMPFEADSFDLVVTQAAFKNFSHPAEVLKEFFRVLRPGAIAVVEDMHSGVTNAEIASEVGAMSLGRGGALFTGAILRWLRRRAYSRDRFERLVADSPFRTGEVRAEGMNLEVRLQK